MAETKVFDQVNAAASAIRRPVVDVYAPDYKPLPGPTARGFKTAMAGAKAAAGGLAAVAGDITRIKPLQQYGLDVAQRANAEAAQTAMPVEGVTGVKGVADFAKYAVGYTGGNLLTLLAGGALGRVGGAALARGVPAAAEKLLLQNAATAAGAAASSIGQEVGSIYPDAVASGVPDAAARSVIGGVAAGALDLAPTALLANKLGLFGTRAVKAAGARTAAGVAKGVAKGALIGAGIEGGTEVAQTAIEHVAAGQPLTGDQAFSDFLNSGVLGAVGGGVFGGVAGGVDAARAPTVAPATPGPAPTAAPATPGPAPTAAPATPGPAPTAAPAAPGPAAPAPAPTAFQSAKPEDLQIVQEADRLALVDQSAGTATDTEKQLFTVQDRRTAVANQLSLLDSEEKLPKNQRRAKQEIVKERKALTAEHASLVQRESNLATIIAGPEYQQKTRIAQPTIIGEQQTPAVAQPIITPDQDALMRIAEREAANAADQIEIQGSVQPQRGSGTARRQTAGTGASYSLRRQAESLGAETPRGASSVQTRLALSKRARGQLLTTEEAVAVRQFESTTPEITPVVSSARTPEAHAVMMAAGQPIPAPAVTVTPAGKTRIVEPHVIGQAPVKHDTSAAMAQIAQIKKSRGMLLSAEELLAVRKSEQPATQAQALAKVTSSARETVKQPGGRTARDNFVNTYSAAVDKVVNDLAAQVAWPAQRVDSLKSRLKAAAEQAVKQPDGESAQRVLDEGFAAALKAKLPAGDVETFGQKLAAEVAATAPSIVQTYFSKAAMARGFPDKIWRLHEKARAAEQAISEPVSMKPSGKYPTTGEQKARATMAFRALRKAALEHTNGDEQASLELMREMNSESKRREQFSQAAITPSETVAFTHWGNVPGGVTDPSKMGTGVKGADWAAARAVGLSYTSAVVHGSKYTEPDVQSRAQHTGVLDASKVYQARSDDPLLVQSRAEIAAQFGPDEGIAWMQYAKNVRDLGYDAMLYANGQLRIFTPQPVRQVPGKQQVSKSVAKVLSLHAANDGASFNLVTEQDLGGTKTYTVSPFKDREVVLQGKDIPPSVLAKYIDANMDLLSDPRNILGTWYNTKDGMTYLDVSITVPSMRSALRLAAENDQLAIFDLRTFTEIPVDHPVFNSAQAYTADVVGLPPLHDVPYIEVDAQRGTEIAKAYEGLQDHNTDPLVAAAYEAFATEIEAQYDAAAAVITIEPWAQEGQPYADSREMSADVFGNNHLWVFTGGDPHPYLTPEQNVKFRAIHDIYGHAKTGFEFGPRGELNATRAHAQMFSPAAVPALVTETIGQNSWVNFSEANAGLPADQRAFATQKADLLPEALWAPLLKDGNVARSMAVQRFDNAFAHKGVRMLEALEAIVGTPARLTAKVLGSVEGGTGAVRFSNARDVIELSIHAKDGTSLAAHEGFHYLEQRVLSRDEKAIISRAFKRGSAAYNMLVARARAYDAVNKTNIAAEIIGSQREAHAYGYEFWNRGELTATDTLTRVFQKIRQVLERIANMVHGHGFQSREDIFRAIKAGGYARRESNVFGAYVPDAHSRGAMSRGSTSLLSKEFSTSARVKFLMLVRSAGGIPAKFARDVSGEAGNGANRMYPGLFSNTAPNFDLLAQSLVERGYMAESELDTVDGGVSRVVDLLRDFMAGDFVGTFEDQDAMAELQAQEFGGLHSSWTDTRVDSLLSWYAYAMDGQRSKAMAGHVDPTAFLNATTPTEEARARIRSESVSLDPDALKSTDAITLWVDTDEAGGLKVIGHEGRHRMVALADAGVDSVPVVLKFYDGASRAPQASAILAGQEFRAGTGEPITVDNLVPVAYDYRAQLIDTFGGAADVMFSQAATVESLGEMAMRVNAGELPRTQLNMRIAEIFDDRTIPAGLKDRLISRPGGELQAFGGSVKRFLAENVMSGQNLSRKSAGYRNVFGTLTSYVQRKNVLIADAVEKRLSTWVRGASKEDKVVTSAALLTRTENAWTVNDEGYRSLRASLTERQRGMFDQATEMINSRLDAELQAEIPTYRKFLDGESFKEWYENRYAQVERLKAEGYFPERRFGDHVVHGYVTTPDGKHVTAYFSQHEREADARHELDELHRLAGNEGLTFEYGYRYRAEYDGSVSFAQFLTTADRAGIALTQPEKERIGKALIAADSTRRNRVFRRQNIAGYSQDGMRILAEFGVTMANKIAYSELGEAINDSLAGRQVNVSFNNRGEVQVDTLADSNVWAQDGADAGFYRNQADQTTEFVLSPRAVSPVASKLKAFATAHFLGGSIAAGMVNLSSLPMNTVPWLTQHTSYTDAMGKVLGAMKTSAANFKGIVDLPTLLDNSKPMPGIDEVEGLRHALQVAAQDGTILDTEIYQIMGLSRGQEYSLTGGVQKAIQVWMTPFRLAEQMNRMATFIAAFKVAKDKKLDNNAAYQLAQDTVYSTQFRYDDANRPALARGDFGSLLFVFKSYPIFVLETMNFLARENPRAAAFMLGSLVLTAGLQGVPFAEDLEDLIDTIAQRIFHSPFQTQRWLHNTLKSASEAAVGADLSSVLMHGMANTFTELNFSSRVGLSNLIPGTRIGTADADYKSVMTEIIGPTGSMIGGVLGGADALSRGEFMEAGRKALPLGAQNFLKGMQQWDKGFATDTFGRKLVDISGWEAFWQTFGMSSAAVASAYDADRVDRRSVAFYNAARNQFQSDIVKAIGSGDSERIAEATDAIAGWNSAHPDMPVSISPTSIRRNVAQAGMTINQRALAGMPRALRAQSEAAIGLDEE